MYLGVFCGFFVVYLSQYKLSPPIYLNIFSAYITRTENPAELNRDKIVTELNNLKAMITQTQNI